MATELKGTMKLREAYPIVNQNFTDVENNINNHKNSDNPAHPASKVSYDSTGNTKVLGDDVEEALDNIETEFKAIISGDANAEVGSAHNSAAKNKVFTDIDERFESLELSTGINLTDFGSPVNGDWSNVFQDALLYCSVNEKVLLLPNNRYVIKLPTFIYSNTKIIGQSKNGVIIETTNDNLDVRSRNFKALGTIEEPLENIEIYNVTFDTQTTSRFGIENVNNFTMINCRFTNHAGIRLDRVNNFYLDKIDIKDANYGVSLYTSNKGFIGMLNLLDCPEGIDFYNCSDIEVDKIIGYDTSEHIEQDEVVDIGASKDIIINNIIAKGYYSGILIKNEEGGYAFDNIQINNCIFIDCARQIIGVQIKGGIHLPLTNNGTVKISNVHGVSTIDDCRGVMIDNLDADSLPFDNITFNNCSFKTKGYTFSTQRTSSTLELFGKIDLIDSKFISENGYGIYLRKTKNINIINTEVTSLATLSGIYAIDSKYIFIDKAKIYDVLSCFQGFNSLDIDIINSRITNCRSNVVSLTTDKYIDFDKILRFNNNDIVDYSVVDNFKSMVILTTNQPLKKLYIKDNSIKINDTVLNTTYGISISATGGLVKNVIIKNNVSENLTTLIPTSTRNNIELATSIINENIEDDTVSNIIDLLEGSLAWDPPTLADGEGITSNDITVTGAIIRDYVLVGAPYDLQGITCSGYVSSPNTIKIRLQNETGGIINLANGTWKVKIIKQ